ncbi:MAG: hypothetical protein AAFR84_06115 [Pseudomonadota bacterium]
MRKFMMIIALAIGLATPAAADDWAVALPIAMPQGKAAVEQPLWEVFTEVIAPGDRYRVLNGTEPGRIALLEVPDKTSMARKTRRAHHFRAENAEIYGFLQTMETGPAALDLTGLLRREAVQRRGQTAPLALLVIGDPVQAMPSSPSFSMRDETGTLRIPSDRHHAVPLSVSPWGIGLEGMNGLSGLTLHLCATGDPLSPVETAALQRFWAHYLAARGGVLATWETGDLGSCVERFAARVAVPLITEDPNEHDRDLVMRKIGQPDTETVTGTGATPVVNGVEVDDFSLFADTAHPTLSGVTVVTGVRYAPKDYPKRYELAWCYFNVRRNGTDIRLDLGTKRQGKPVSPRVPTASARRAAGIKVSDVEAGARACQWPTS